MANPERQLFIDGRSRPVSTGRTEQDVNPHTGEVVATVTAALPG